MCNVPYLWNSMAYDHDFWYNCVKWWYLQAFFHFLGCYVGKRAKNSPKWKIVITCVMYHILGTVNHMIMIFSTLVLNDDISRGFFFIFFFNFLFFEVLRGIGGGGGKRVKNCRKWKITTTSIACHISGTL